MQNKKFKLTLPCKVIKVHEAIEMKIQELTGEIFRRRRAVIDDCLDVEGEEDRRVWEDIQVSDLGNWVRGNC